MPELLREEFTCLLVCKNNVCPEFYVLVHDEIHQKDSVNSFYFKFPVVPRPALVDDGTGEIEDGAFFKIALHAVLHFDNYLFARVRGAVDIVDDASSFRVVRQLFVVQKC